MEKLTTFGASLNNYTRERYDIKDPIPMKGHINGWIDDRNPHYYDINKPMAKKVLFGSSKSINEGAAQTITSVMNFSKFVSYYSKRHGIKYRDALKDKAVKDAYRQQIDPVNQVQISQFPDKKIERFPPRYVKIDFTKQPTSVDERDNDDFNRVGYVSFDMNKQSVEKRIKYENLSVMFEELKDNLLRAPQISTIIEKPYNMTNFNPLFYENILKVVELFHGRSGNIFDVSLLSELGFFYKVEGNEKDRKTLVDTYDNYDKLVVCEKYGLDIYDNRLNQL